MALPEAKPSLADSPKLDYLRTIKFIFENPNWLLNVLWSFLCQLVAQVIPILPQMVSTGYQFEVLDGLLASRGARYPDFNINRLGDYLIRGVWPILAALIVALIWTPIFIVVLAVMIGCIAALGAAGGEEAGTVLAMFGVFGAIVFTVLLVAALLVVVTPLMLRAGMTQDFVAAFDFGWISDFLKKMWLEVLLATLFIIVAAVAVTMVTCGLGALIVGPLLPFVSTHFWFQIYSLYLSRGGSPVVRKIAPQPVLAPK
jgi:hypothetical protein